MALNDLSESWIQGIFTAGVTVAKNALPDMYSRIYYVLWLWHTGTFQSTFSIMHRAMSMACMQ